MNVLFNDCLLTIMYIYTLCGLRYTTPQQVIPITIYHFFILHFIDASRCAADGHVCQMVGFSLRCGKLYVADDDVFCCLAFCDDREQA